MDESEILRLLKNEIREQHFVIFGLNYDKVDQKYRFPSGTTRKYADECGYDVEVVEGQDDWVALKCRADGVIPTDG